MIVLFEFKLSNILYSNVAVIAEAAEAFKILLHKIKMRCNPKYFS